MIEPTVTLTHLHRADGSATYTHNGYSIIGAVNGPIEVQRRDELPEEAAIEVNVRPSIGVGSPRERHQETLLHNTLRSIILTRTLPRALIQITLQVRTLPLEDGTTGVNSSLTLLPHLLHTALLALLSASIPMRTTLTAVLIAQPSSPAKNIVPSLLSPSAHDLVRSKPVRAVHVFAFAGDGRMLLNESDGRFSFEEWNEACRMAEVVCCGEEEEEEEEEEEKDGGGVELEAEGEAMDVDAQAQKESLDLWLRSVVRRKVEGEQRWRRAT
ncbi:hypothetical protein BDW02DRAFT_631882 [Decorospora gaudefroyi]|uniref:Exoribonuclease phosphorolytic domain-containing protein n=1 Tax=Decorospora gaudefroyi TaxID=184978 RepID=A0A6A5K4M7_9PLEO|nr:hypothetical protein BDW02DRAFT_631882 [Decorospora gaudefroyi]